MIKSFSSKKYFWAIIASGVLFWTHGGVQANPSGEVLISGDASFQRDGAGLTIDQFSDQVIIDWDTFSIGNGELTLFNQPHAGALAINRVVTDAPSFVYGTLKANGEIILINPAGIVVGPSGQIDTAAFTASSLDLDLDRFLQTGQRRFAGTSEAAIINQGTIRALGGDVYLLASQVKNTGQISAPDGTVGIAAASDVLLREKQNPQGTIEIKAATGENRGIENQGSIEAAVVELKAAGGNLYALAINNEGHIHARGAARTQDGRVLLIADEGNINQAGLIQAQKISGEGGHVQVQAKQGRVTFEGAAQVSGTRGGSIHLLGEKVSLKTGAALDAQGLDKGGEILIGGDWQGNNPDIQNTKVTEVESGAIIKADAIGAGEGGKVVVWADHATLFQGSISARGGAEGGNGGQVEVSGKNYLDYRGEVDTRAPAGQTGLLLLDPSDILISPSLDIDIVLSGNTYMDGPIPVTPSQLSVATLTAALATSNIIVTTNSAEADQGDIIVSAPIFWASPYKLSLLADNDISVLSPINAPNGQLFLSAGQSNPYGQIVIGAGATINVDQLKMIASGDITLNDDVTSNLSAEFQAGGDFSNLGADINVLNPGESLLIQAGTQHLGALTIQGDLTAGTIVLEASQGIGLTSTITSTDGPITIELDKNFDGNGVFSASGGIINAASGQPITIVATDYITSATTINGNDVLTIAPSIAGTPIYLGFAPPPLFSIDPVEFSGFSAALSHIIIGSPIAGPLTMTLGSFPQSHLTLIGDQIQTLTGIGLLNQTLDLIATGGDMVIAGIGATNSLLNINSAGDLTFSSGFLISFNSNFYFSVGGDINQQMPYSINLIQSFGSINNNGSYNTTGDFNLNSNSLLLIECSSIFSFNATLSISASDIIIQSNDIIFSGVGAVGNGNIILSSNQNFINLTGPTALTAIGTGRWLVYALYEGTSFTNGLLGDWDPEYGFAYPLFPSQPGSGFIYLLGNKFYDLSLLLDDWENFFFNSMSDDWLAAFYDAEGKFVFEDGEDNYASEGDIYNFNDQEGIISKEAEADQGLLWGDSSVTAATFENLPKSIKENLTLEKKNKLQEAIDAYKRLPRIAPDENAVLLPNQAMILQSGSINRIAPQQLPEVIQRALRPGIRQRLRSAIAS
jgi:filamentous hemagglutinin family protein